ncbi:MAG: polysaccharide-degrading enzyme [bacterium]|nr:polysaccharide-degrading enzyme [bacterium]
MIALRLVISCLLALVLSAPAGAVDYHVGPGQPLAAVGDAPWASLQPGDRVLIHWRAEPYAEKWVINRRGTPEAWITVRGLPSPQGQLPVIDGRDAETAPGLNFWNEERGVIKVGGSNTPPDGLPAYIVIEGLEIRSGRPPFSFTNDGGGTSSYADNAASIYIEKAEHLIIRDCVIHDSGNGIFSGAFDGQTRDLLIEGNHLFGNGNVGSAFHHNTYTSAVGIAYQYNRFGALRAGADGNNLKDRSAGLVVRYNWIEDGNRQLDLVDGELEVAAEPGYGETFVYGNVLIESDDQGNSQVVHYGGDGGDTGLYRKGTLHFYNNTVVSTRTGNTTLLRLSTNDEAADVRNNVLYASASGDRLAMLAAAGDLTLRHNWLKPGWRDSHSGLTGTIDDDGSSILGAAPGFLDEPSQNYRPAAGAPLIEAGTLPHLATAAHPVLRHYVRHTTHEPRPTDAVVDVGAWERCPTDCLAIFTDGFESGETSEWSASVP